MTTKLTREEIQRRVNELGPWIQPFEFEGTTYLDQGQRPAALPPEGLIRESRTVSFYEEFPDARRILELGACEGADTVPLASREGAQVIAVEGREENLRRAEFVLELHGLTNVQEIVADVEEIDLAQWGRFDAVVCAGLLYHLEKPWALLQAISGITDNVLLWTHYWGSEEDTATQADYQTKAVEERYIEPRLNGLQPVSHWLTWSSLHRAIADAGFGQVKQLEERGEGPVRNVTLILRR